MFTRLFVTFRAQAVAFITALLLLTAVVIFLINQAVERRTTRQVNEYFQSIILAIDLSYRSLAEGKELADMVNLPNSLPINSESAISHIIIVDVENKKVFDSTSRGETGKPYDSTAIPTFAPGDVKLDSDVHTVDDSITVKFSIETDADKKRDILIVLSMRRLQRVKQAAERDRNIALIVFGILLVSAVAYFATRFMQPITNLSRAAQRVTAGDLDFSVPVVGRTQELSTLSSTFNDMLNSLRRNRDLEDQLQRAERSAVVGRLASGIAHEIRNPLNFMNLSIDHLQAACAPEAERKQSEFKHITKTIKEEIARLNKLVSDFLSYGRPARLNPRELDARVLIEELRSLVKAQADAQGVTVKIEGAATAPFKADAEQIKTCFSNLMINAVQAMPDGGTLTVTLSESSDPLRLTFTDTGTGIAAENLAQIFEPYYSTKDTGIGLGLPLTKKIIEEHQGQLTVESDPGHGTTFSVTLPRQTN